MHLILSHFYKMSFFSQRPTQAAATLVKPNKVHQLIPVEPAAASSMKPPCDTDTFLAHLTELLSLLLTL